MNWALSLIESYLSCAVALTARLSMAFGEPQLLEARRHRRIPASGVTADGLTFMFHGIGVALNDAQSAIDIDFLPGGELGGFDAWRLHLFTTENRSQVRRSQDEVQTALNELVQTGVIERVDGWSLYRLTSAQ